jgi:hypothetical protein
MRRSLALLGRGSSQESVLRERGEESTESGYERCGDMVAVLLVVAESEREREREEKRGEV